MLQPLNKLVKGQDNDDEDFLSALNNTQDKLER